MIFTSESHQVTLKSKSAYEKTVPLKAMEVLGWEFAFLRYSKEIKFSAFFFTNSGMEVIQLSYCKQIVERFSFIPRERGTLLLQWDNPKNKSIDLNYSLKFADCLDTLLFENDVMYCTSSTRRNHTIASDNSSSTTFESNFFYNKLMKNTFGLCLIPVAVTLIDLLPGRDYVFLLPQLSIRLIITWLEFLKKSCKLVKCIYYAFKEAVKLLCSDETDKLIQVIDEVLGRWNSKRTSSISNSQAKKIH